jgi:hypothetical protein
MSFPLYSLELLVKLSLGIALMRNGDHHAMLCVAMIGIGAMQPFLPDLINDFFNDDQTKVYWYSGGVDGFANMATFLSSGTSLLTWLYPLTWRLKRDTF